MDDDEYYGDPLYTLEKEFPEYSRDQLIDIWSEYSETLCAGWLIGYRNYTREEFISLFANHGVDLP